MTLTVQAEQSVRVSIDPFTRFSSLPHDVQCIASAQSRSPEFVAHSPTHGAPWSHQTVCAFSNDELEVRT